MLVATVIAVRQALDYTSTGRAVAVVFIGFVVYILCTMVLAAIGVAGGVAAGGLAGLGGLVF